MITQTTPSITNAAEYKETHGSIPGGSIIRTTDNRLMVVERSNGYVISGMEQGKTGIGANMVIDLRNTSATIVTVTTFVDDTPAPAPTQAKAAKPVKLSAAQKRELESIAADSKERCGHESATVKVLIRHKMVKTSARYDVRYGWYYTPELTDAGRAAIAQPAPVEVKPAPEAPKTAIVYRELCEDQPNEKRGYPTQKRTYRRCENCETQFLAPQAQCYCGNCYVEWEFQGSVTVKPTASPALVETGERVIAITPMALESYTVNRGAGRIYRVTSHSPRQWSLEVWNADDGEWKHVRNHSNPADIGMTIIEIAPAPVVKVYSPAISDCIKPDNFTPERIASAQDRVMEAIEIYWLHYRVMEARSKAGQYTGNHEKHIRDSVTLSRLDLDLGRAATAYAQMVSLTNAGGAE